MAQVGQRKCLCCGDFFNPDQRKRERQRYCAASDCRIASHAASQAAWLAKPQNKDYFRDPPHVARVQTWRVAHPGCSRSKPRKARIRPALQEALIAQAPDLIEEPSIRGERAVLRGKPRGADCQSLNVMYTSHRLLPNWMALWPAHTRACSAAFPGLNHSFHASVDSGSSFSSARATGQAG